MLDGLSSSKILKNKNKKTLETESPISVHDLKHSTSHNHLLNSLPCPWEKQHESHKEKVVKFKANVLVHQTLVWESKFAASDFYG